jgi:hypothetical protein
MYIDLTIGKPQEIIISPTLANLTFNGLEKDVHNSIRPITTATH